MTQITITMQDAYPLCMDILKAKKVPFLMSSPGIGKSALAHHIAKENNLFLIDVRLASYDPTEMNGYPYIWDDEHKKKRAGHVPMITFPIETDAIPEGYSGWLILLDEFNSAPLTVQAAAYKFVLDRMVGVHKLHNRCAIIAAGNLSTDKAIVNRTGTAMQSRLIHLTIRADFPSWIIWANHNGIDHRVKSFLTFKKELLHKFDPNHNDVTFPCPRTWEFTSDIIKPWKQVTLPKLPVLTGTVGDGAGREFYAFSQIFDKIPTFEEIVAKPDTVKFGDDPSMQYALVGLVSSRITPSNADAVIDFISRLTIDFQVSALRACIAREPAVKKSDKYIAWIAQNAEEYVHQGY